METSNGHCGCVGGNSDPRVVLQKHQAFLSPPFLNILASVIVSPQQPPELIPEVFPMPLCLIADGLNLN